MDEQPNNDVANALLSQFNNESYCDYSKAVAYIRLAIIIANENNDIPIPKNFYQNLLKISRNAGLPLNLRRQATMQLIDHRFQIENHEKSNDLYSETFATKLIKNPTFPPLFTVVVDESIWAKKTILRLMIEDRTQTTPIQTGFDYALELIDNDNISDNERLDYWYAMALFRYHSKNEPLLTPQDDYTSSEAENHLPILLRDEQRPERRLKIKMLLANMLTRRGIESGDMDALERAESLASDVLGNSPTDSKEHKDAMATLSTIMYHSSCQ